MTRAFQEYLTASPWLIRAYRQHMLAEIQSVLSTGHAFDLCIIIILCDIKSHHWLLKARCGKRQSHCAKTCRLLELSTLSF